MLRRLTHPFHPSTTRRLSILLAALLGLLVAACSGAQQPAEAPARHMVTAANPLAA